MNRAVLAILITTLMFPHLTFAKDSSPRPTTDIRSEFRDPNRPSSSEIVFAPATRFVAWLGARWEQLNEIFRSTTCSLSSRISADFLGKFCSEDLTPAPEGPA